MSTSCEHRYAVVILSYPVQDGVVLSHDLDECEVELFGIAGCDEAEAFVEHQAKTRSEFAQAVACGTSVAYHRSWMERYNKRHPTS